MKAIITGLCFLLCMSMLLSRCDQPTPGDGMRRRVDAPPGHAAAEVDRAMFGERWPLTVDRGVVERIPTRIGERDLSICTFKSPDGKVYALNGTAKSRGIAEIRPIWRDDPEMPGLKVDISPLLQFAINMR